MPNILIIRASLLVGVILCNDEKKDLETLNRLFKATNRVNSRSQDWNLR